MTAPRLTIFGSCVSRDTYEAALRDRLKLETYVARQSLISAFSPARSDVGLDLDLLPHAFQRRMLEGDLSGSVVTVAQTLTKPGAHVLVDIVDERHGVYRLPDGGYVTRSLESMTCGIDAVAKERGWELVAFGSDEHFALWSDALGRLLTTLRELPEPPDVTAVAVAWAEHDQEGRPTPASFSVTAAQANATQTRYLHEFTRYPWVRVASPRSVPVADAGHRWGVAPFHYTQQTYAELAAAILDEDG